MEMLRRFQSEPTLANSHRESGNFKIKSDLRQSILHRHRHLTPMSDKRHNARSTNALAPKQQHLGKRRRQRAFLEKRRDGASPTRMRKRIFSILPGWQEFLSGTLSQWVEKFSLALMMMMMTEMLFPHESISIKLFYQGYWYSRTRQLFWREKKHLVDIDLSNGLDADEQSNLILLSHF